MQTIREVLTIPNGGTDSPALTDVREMAQMAAVTIVAPAALTGACTLQVNDGAGAYRTAQSPAGTDVALAAGKAVILPPFGAVDFRIHSAGAEAAARDFVVYIQSYR